MGRKRRNVNIDCRKLCEFCIFSLTFLMRSRIVNATELTTPRRTATPVNQMEKTMTLEILQIESGFAIDIPFKLNDSFKNAVPSAKWNKDQRRWEAGPRSRKRIESWLDEINPSKIVERINAEDAAEMTEKELASVRHELNLIKKSLGEMSEIKERHQRAIDALESVRDDISGAQKSLAEETAEAAKLKADVSAQVASIIKLNDVYAAYATMCKHAGSVGSVARGSFEQAQNVIQTELNRLRKVGLTSPSMWRLVSLNFNRSGNRDDPRSTRRENITYVVPYEPSDD
jgi:hypothetical protein